MFSLTRKKNPDSDSAPLPQDDSADKVARVAISGDGQQVFANEPFKALSGHSKSGIDFHFNWLITPDNKRYLVGSESPKEESAAGNDFQLLADLSEDIMMVVGESGNILRANAAFGKIFGFTSSEIEKLDFIDLFHAEEKPYIRNTIRSLGLDDASGNAVMDFQARIITRSGETRWIEWRQRQIGEQMYCTGRDITALREQQFAMGRRERQLSQAESIGRMGHWNWTLGQEEIEWSAEIYNIFGVKPENFRPTMDNINALIHKRDLSRVNHVFQRATIGQNNYEMEFRVQRPDGETRFLRCEGRCARDNNGEVTALYGIMQDMTERILYERELKESKDAAERAYASKSQFLANMSHELRTPLNAILGFSEMIQRQLLGPIGTEKYLEYIGGIRESGEHLLDMISDILDMSKIEAGKYELAHEEVNVLKTIRLAAHMMESRASDAEVTLSIDKVTNENLVIVADRRAFLQVLLNILSNAVKFTPKGGLVSVECIERKDTISLKISDNGIGIPANKLASITNPFEQVSSHYTREHDGTGLGLAITKELVEMHNGALLIDSTLNIGTTVTVRLPYDSTKKK